MNMNPNSDSDWVDNVDVNGAEYPFFLHKVEIEEFRHICNTDITFKHPISIISGSNKSGKTSILSVIACSHFNFQMRSPSSGIHERITWSKFLKFTKHDTQHSDWSYHLTYRRGAEIPARKKGLRKARTKKWSGLGKKESQIKDRQVVFIDVDRVSPARSYSHSLFWKTQHSTAVSLSSTIIGYLSYILEEAYTGAHKLGSHQNKVSYRFNDAYSSFNCASGEDVLTYVLTEIVNADEKALILIDEIELGLHPKIQRRLIDVIKHESRQSKKQFIITTHSPSIVSSFSARSRLFIEKKADGMLQCYEGLSVNGTFTKMDSFIYPAINIICEDNTAKAIISHCINNFIPSEHLKLANILPMGPANDAYGFFRLSQKANENLKVKMPVCCVLDGDMREKKDGNSNHMYPVQAALYFLASNEAPEKMLLRSYLLDNQNDALSYHLETSNPHCLFDKCVEQGLASTGDEVRAMLIRAYADSEQGKVSMMSLALFINSHIVNTL
ncbi:MAG: AAA family ATPase [Kiritimatiellae bacterium]|nr:AAA family ATPase [Kiritimatiellia bacterium]